MSMEATVKLFYEDSHLKEFDAVVCSCMPDGKRYRIVLDKTAFFRRAEDSTQIRGISVK